jgi:ankyrin repeat protein
VRRFVQIEPALLTARMSRNEHEGSPLHHVAAVNRPDMVRLLIDLGTDVNATDSTAGTPLTTAAREHADPRIITMLEQAGARLDLRAALTLRRYDVAARMLTEDPARIEPGGRDTIALHVLVAKRDAEHGAIELARMLLDAGANPGIRDDKYQATVLGWAEWCGQPQISELLRQRGVTA